MHCVMVPPPPPPPSPCSSTDGFDARPQKSRPACQSPRVQPFERRQAFWGGGLPYVRSPRHRRTALHRDGPGPFRRRRVQRPAWRDPDVGGLRRFQRQGPQATAEARWAAAGRQWRLRSRQWANLDPCHTGAGISRWPPVQLAGAASGRSQHVPVVQIPTMTFGYTASALCSNCSRLIRGRRGLGLTSKLAGMRTRIRRQDKLN